jgi:hypothetical protein
MDNFPLRHGSKNVATTYYEEYPRKTSKGLWRRAYPAIATVLIRPVGWPFGVPQDGVRSDSTRANADSAVRRYLLVIQPQRSSGTGNTEVGRQPDRRGPEGFRNSTVGAHEFDAKPPAVPPLVPTAWELRRVFCCPLLSSENNGQQWYQAILIHAHLPKGHSYSTAHSSVWDGRCRHCCPLLLPDGQGSPTRPLGSHIGPWRRAPVLPRWASDLPRWALRLGTTSVSVRPRQHRQFRQLPCRVRRGSARTESLILTSISRAYVGRRWRR